MKEIFVLIRLINLSQEPMWKKQKSSWTISNHSSHFISPENNFIYLFILFNTLFNVNVYNN